MASIFASENGVILEIEQFSNEWEYSNPFYFNCSLISNYTSEDERICVGGNGFLSSRHVYPWTGGYFQVRTIRLMAEGINLYWYCRALTIFNIIIDGTDMRHEDFKKRFVKS